MEDKILLTRVCKILCQQSFLPDENGGCPECKSFQDTSVDQIDCTLYYMFEREAKAAILEILRYLNG